MASVLTGGEKLMAYLRTIDARLASAGSGPNVRVGFLEDQVYPDTGISVALVAAQNEFGGTFQQPARTITLYRKMHKSGTHLLRNGRFVKKSQSNYQTQHEVGAHEITVPPRPYFRQMIKAKAPAWGDTMAKFLKSTDFDAAKTLRGMGEIIAGQLQTSIRDFKIPGNAPSTIARKGFDDPLIDTGHMYRSVRFEVSI